jgi:hypothetical protein
MSTKRFTILTTLSCVAVLAGAQAEANAAPQARAALGPNVRTAVSQIDASGRSSAPASTLPALHAFGVKAYMKDFGVDEAEASAALEQQRRGEDIETSLHDALGDDYLGARFDNAARRWEISLAPGADEGPVRDYVESRRLTGAKIVHEAWTGEDRDQAVAALRRKLAPEIARGRLTVSNGGTRIELRSAAGDTAAEAKARAAAASTAVDAKVVESASDDLLASPSAECNNIWCNPPLRAGERMVRQSAGGFCTTGFPATSPINSWDNFAMTAGHCVAAGNTLGKCSLVTCYVPIGYEYSGYYGGGDGGLLLIDHNYPTYGAWWPPQWGDALPVRPPQLPANGTQVCHTGTNSYGGVDETVVSCGYIISNDTPVNYTDGTSLQHMIEVGNSASLCVAKGNSGGPVVRGDTAAAVGIYSGDNAPGPGTPNYGQRVCGSGYHFFAEPALNAQAVLGVSIKTS